MAERPPAFGRSHDPVDESPSGPAGDDERLTHYAESLADGVASALPRWVEASVFRRLPPDADRTAELERTVAEAGRAAAEDVGGRVRELLALDIDEQWTNPLTLLRTAVRYPTDVLRDVGAPEVPRDDQARRFHPEDVFDLTPASFADFGQDVGDLGLRWGAAKAHVHLRRRREEEVT